MTQNSDLQKAVQLILSISSHPIAIAIAIREERW